MVAKSLDLKTVCRWGAFTLFLLDRALQGCEAYKNFGTGFLHTGAIRGGTGQKTALYSHLLTHLIEEEDVSHSA